MASKRNVTWKCPFCDKRFDREKLVIHVDDKHENEIPEGFTALRYVFHYVNKRPLDYHGRCTECKGPTPWDEEVGRYKRQCGKKACHDSYVKRFEDNMVKKKGYTRETSTQEGLERMLKNRKISGQYTFQNGEKKDYVGSYEKKCLEFMDKVMNIDPNDILSPGPVLEYKYEGKKHYYISDFYYQPYNLVIEVKDGGDNPNTRNMEEYRRKQIAKEEYIIKNTDFNYIRLTNNDFGQLMSIFADLKMQLVDNSKDRVIHVNEAVDMENKTFKSDIDLMNWMYDNIKYSNFTKLKSHDEVLKSKSGSCHDQVMFEYIELKKLGYNPKGLFFIEVDDKGQGGTTHSLVYYRNKEKNICWFENAWRDMAGINRASDDYNTITGIKRWIKELHDNKDFGNKEKYPKLIFHAFSIPSHKPGESLQEFIDICLDGNINESVVDEDAVFNEFMNALTSGYFPGYEDCDAYICTADYMQNNVFANCGQNFFAIASDPGLHNLIYVNNEGVLTSSSLEEFEKIYPNVIGHMNVFALKIPMSGIHNALANYIGEILDREGMYYSVFKEHLYTIDQVRFSDKVLGEINNESNNFDTIYAMTKGTLIYNESDMIPMEDNKFYNYRDGKTYMRSEVNPDFFVETTSPKNKVFMEQILVGGMVNNG